MAQGNNREIRRLTKGVPPGLTEAARGNEVIDLLNALQNMEVTVSTRTPSGIRVSGTNSILNINPADINLGTITGSRGSNAALESLIGALGEMFTIDDDTS